MQSRLLASHSTIHHIFTTRHGGVSTAPYSSNNVAFHVGDDRHDVNTNHARLARELDYDLSRLVHMRQIHSDKIIIVRDEHMFTNPPECDAIMTDQTGIPLMVMTADCTPILLYDPVHHVIAAVHAGRVGAFKAIAAKTIQKMQTVFSSDPTEIKAVLGPSIHRCCYEVGKVVANEADKNGFGYAISSNTGRYYLDVNRIIKRQLETASVLQENIEELNLCTSCQHETFFSYRADHQQTGRMAGVIMLNDVKN